MKYVSWLSEKILGLLFIFAATLKALDLPSFLVQTRYYGVVMDPEWLWWITVGTVAVETLLGIAMLTGVRLRFVVPVLTAAMLIGFTALIVYAWVYNDLEDCGCFGRYIPLGPEESIVKNAIMLVLAGLAWAPRRKAADAEKKPRHWPARVAATVASLAVVGGAVALGNNATFWRSHSTDRPFAEYQVPGRDGTVLNLAEGTYFVGMLSTTCEHCQAAGELMNEITYFPDTPPVVALMLGEGDDLTDFEERVGPEYPLMLIDVLDFVQLIGSEPPRFYIVTDGYPVRQFDVLDPTLEQLMKFIHDEPVAAPASATQE